MIDTRVIATKIDIDSPYNISLYKDEALKELISNKFKGKCFQGIFITEVIGIKNRSAITMTALNGSIDVEFIAKGLYLPDNSIISGVEITLASEFIAGEIKYLVDDNLVSIATVYLNDEISTEILNVGNVVPIRVLASRYPPMSNKITLMGELLTCDLEEQIFNVENNITEENKQTITMLKQEIDIELKIRSGRSEEDLEKILNFDRLLHSFNTTGQKLKNVNFSGWIGKEIPNKDGIVDILSIDIDSFDFTGQWSKSLDIYLSSPLVRKLSDTPEETTTETSGIFIISVLETALSYLKITKEMATSYDEELFNKNLVVWKSMEKRQIKN